jgi:parallel beta-helix repeat protein
MAVREEWGRRMNTPSSAPWRHTIKLVSVVASTVGIVLVSAMNATAATYYVATNGSDATSCAQAQNLSTPKRTIMGGVSCLALGGGDTLDIRSGTYSESLTTNSRAWPTAGSYSTATTIRAHAGETVVITPTNNSGIALSGPAAYIIFERLIVDGSYCSGCNELIWIGNGAHHIRLLNVEGRNNSGGQIAAVNQDGSFVEFLGGSYHDALGGNDSAIPPGGYCFYIAGKDNLVDHVKAYNCIGYGLHIYVNKSDHPGASPDRNVVRYSEIYNIRTNPSYSIATGVLLGTGVGNVAYGNVVHDIDGGGLVSGNGASDSKIYNNTAVRNRWGIATGNTSSPVIRNNIMVGNTDAQFYDWGSTSSIVFSNNLCSSSGTGCASVGDPMFVNTSGNDFTLRSGSPAIDRGMTLSDIPATDGIGTPRPQGSGWDIGAFEYSTGGTSSAPAAPNNLRITS